VDDLPSVERVARVVQQQVGPVDQRQDAAATEVAATLILLRQLMKYQSAVEASSGAAAARLQAIDAEYQRAELAIGLGLGRRAGGLNAAQVAQFYESRAHQKCATADCYAYWLKMQLEQWGAFDFRRRMLPLLFPCERANQFLELMNRNAMSAPLVPETPALRKTLLGSAAPSAAPPASCAASGLDVDGDGQCSDWELHLHDFQSQPPVTSSCAPLILVRATTPDAESISVKYRITPQFGIQPLRLVACRATNIAVRSCVGPQVVPIGQEVVSSPADLAVGEHEIQILKGHVLAPDTKHPYIIVLADTAGETTQTWFQKRLVGVLVHGYAFHVGPAIAKFLSDPGTKDVDEGWFEQYVKDWVLNDGKIVPWELDMGKSLLERACYDPDSFAFNWRYDSTRPMPMIPTERAGDLYADIVALAHKLEARHDGDVVDVHLIGHSRGAVVVGETLKRWHDHRDAALAGAYIKVTLLDPHPADNKFVPQENVRPGSLDGKCHTAYTMIQERTKDPAINLPEGIGLREVLLFYQQTTYAQIQSTHKYATDDDITCPMNLWGQSGGKVRTVTVPRGIKFTVVNLTGRKLADGRIIDHGAVPTWYQQIIDKAAPASCDLPP
jgi:hypothetical protein